MTQNSTAAELNAFLIQKIYSLYGEYNEGREIKDKKNIVRSLPIYLFHASQGSHLYAASTPSKSSDKPVSEQEAMQYIKTRGDKRFIFQFSPEDELEKKDFVVVNSMYIMQALQLLSLTNLSLRQFRKIPNVHIPDKLINVFFKFSQKDSTISVAPYYKSPIAQEILKKENLLTIFSNLESSEINIQSIGGLNEFFFNPNYIAITDRADFVKLILKKGTEFFSKPTNKELFFNELLFKYQEPDFGYLETLKNCGYLNDQSTIAFQVPIIDIKSIDFSLEALIRLYPLKTTFKTGRNDYVALTNTVCEEINHYFSTNNFLGIQFVSTPTNFNKKSQVLIECKEKNNADEAQLFLSNCLGMAIEITVNIVNDFISKNPSKDTYSCLMNPADAHSTNPAVADSIKLLLDKEILEYQLNETAHTYIKTPELDSNTKPGRTHKI